jgi:hypothetical protein
MLEKIMDWAGRYPHISAPLLCLGSLAFFAIGAFVASLIINARKNAMQELEACEE